MKCDDTVGTARDSLKEVAKCGKLGNYIHSFRHVEKYIPILIIGNCCVITFFTG